MFVICPLCALSSFPFSQEFLSVPVLPGKCKGKKAKWLLHLQNIFLSYILFPLINSLLVILVQRIDFFRLIPL